jgi:hypothetical protein
VFFKTPFCEDSVHQLDKLFLDNIPGVLKDQLIESRSCRHISEGVIEKIAPYLDDFFKNLPVYITPVVAKKIQIQKDFIQRYALLYSQHDDTVQPPLPFMDEDEFIYAVDNCTYTKESLGDYAVWATIGRGKKFFPHSILFHSKKHPEPTTFPSTQNSDLALSYSHYCLICHNRGKDSCTTGLKTEDSFKQGCPLGQKISLMHHLYRQGHVIGALATAMIDNPLIAATGHRICYDCVRSCIFQIQEAVDTPYVESTILNEVMRSPYGFEIYYTLSLWNPLNVQMFLAQPYQGGRIVVVGSGASGMASSYELLQRGFEVIMIEGMVVSDYPQEWHAAIEDASYLMSHESFGFGGIMDYGITKRWNKGYLNVLRTLLQRRSRFSLLCGIRVDSEITIDDIFNDLGAQAIILATGAGAPYVPNIYKSLKNVHFASDYLMGLHLKNPLQMGQITVIIGGGLTAIDSAVEIMKN